MLPCLRLVLVPVLALAAAAAPVAEWHLVEWDSPEFVAFEGDFVVPPVPSDAKRGIPAVWPGLQSGDGVLQSVLDGRSGVWSLGNSFSGASIKSLGDRFDVRPADSVHFSFTRVSSSNEWLCTLSGPYSTSAKYVVSSSPMTRAILAVDLKNVKHDFAAIYNNVVINAATAPARQWCGKTGSRGYDNLQYTILNATANGTTCRIAMVVLPGTA